ncbi:Zinc finger, DksA/TraR C4-type [uncultured Caudovirales phage]|uniref:Zinc finger, DksA/TraR C4-type n=1 Tax=uncultured Caudovirales phage TaxID=2100421 RepID=A0A6J7XTM1_9CAUD|nr:Zinc finger, DksA/TraR C4-type [uncultured Caudovirales phage]CAB4193688.1 Zinc finger, DksA/TraR C4-type [uncultured Caudovirales phage]CAB4217633.1 Zinc finger, DksA/TraR C4-type [uncultured Caudovirales phage]CAB5231442.1 Zinc finger, DksA/TraR C4-type [uncultured Caudovirales phage]
MKNCKTCGTAIPEKRLQILPNTNHCVNCSTAAPVSGYMLVSSIESYSELVLSDLETAEQINHMSSGPWTYMGVTSGPCKIIKGKYLHEERLMVAQSPAVI